MALLKCNECAKEISHSATVCPSCGCTKPFKGQVLSAKQAKHMSGKERYSFVKSGGKIQMSGIQKFFAYIGAAFLGFIALIIILAIIKPPTIEEQAKADKETHEKRARVACMAEIHLRLKDPDSVVYGSNPSDRVVMSDGDNRWTVQLKLKSKNSFNAYVPSTFVCKVALDGQQYKVLSIKEIK